MDIMMNHNPLNPLVDFQLAKDKSKTENRADGFTLQNSQVWVM